MTTENKPVDTLNERVKHLEDISEKLVNANNSLINGLQAMAQGISLLGAALDVVTSEMIDLKIQVNPNLTAKEIHEDLANKVNEIMSSQPGLEELEVEVPEEELVGL